MNFTDKTDIFVNTRLILVLSEHRQFGWKLNLLKAELRAGGSLYIQGTADVKAEIQRGVSENEIALIQAAEEISDKALLKTYSKEKNKEKIPQTTIDNLIRPRIERSCSKILALAQQNNTPVYFRQDMKTSAISDYNQIEILPEKSHCLFNFIKDENGLRYFISLSNEGSEIALQQNRAIVLSDEPCIVLLENQIHQVENIDAKKLLPFFSKKYIEVPASSEKIYIQKFIVKTIPKYEVHLEGIEMKEKFPMKQAILILEQDLSQRLCLSLFFQYDNSRFRPNTQTKKKIVGVKEENGTDIIYWFYRDFDWEIHLFSHLENLGLQKESDNRFYLKQGADSNQKYGLIEWINRHSEELKDFSIQQETNHPFYRGKMEVRSKLNEKIDWFDLEIEVVFDEFTIPFNRFRKHILTGTSEYVLPDGSVFILPEEWFARYHDLFLYAESKQDEVRLKKLHHRILQQSIEFLGIKDPEKSLDKFLQTPLEQAIPSEKLNKLLRPYQKQGFYWLNHLYKLNFGGCLADDMGLGKTIQTITLLESIYYQDEKTEKTPLLNGQLSLFQEYQSSIPASLIVVPTSLLHNWKNELKKFAPDLKVYIHAGIKRLKTLDIEQIFKRYQIIITSYGTVRSDIDYLSRYAFHYLILDESQYIKNPDSVLYKSIKQLNSSHKLALTGTPIENSLLDLWAQFNFINPGLLGSLSFFKENYVNKILKENSKAAEESLLKIIQAFLLRRTKEEVAPDLPPLSQEIVYCDMTEAQEEIYNAEKNSIRNKLLENKDLFVKNRFVALQSLMKLRLLSNHPRLIDSDYKESSGKFDQITLYFESAKESGHKVLIFSSFVKHLKLLAEYFDEKGWKYAMLTGQTQKREEEITKFNQNKDVNCFFISLKAGGTGLNLTAADYVFIIDPWWNPAAEMQALSRSHRIGQNKNVMVYRFISNHSIEEKILHLQDRKIQLSETFVPSNNPLDDLDDKEFVGLFE